MNMTDLHSELATLLFALSKLGQRFPLLGQPAPVPRRRRLSAL